MFSSVWNSEIPSQTIRERSRMRSSETSNVIQRALRVVRWRKRRNDLQETLRYNRDKLTGFHREEKAVFVQAVELVPVESWVIKHNATMELDQQQTSRQWREARIERIRHLQAVRKLERMIAKHHRRTASPQQSPVETVFSYPRPAVNLLGEDTTELALKTLLSDIADDDRRADVAAQCWIVRAEHPSLPPLSVFRRSLEICKQAYRGVYSEKDRRQRRENGIPTNEFGAPMHSKAISYWESSCEQLNKIEREQLAVVIARSSLGREILDKYLQGKSYEQIAQEMGVSVRTIYRRFAALGLQSSVEWSTERNSVFVRVD